jgi:hypothetical protein
MAIYAAPSLKLQNKFQVQTLLDQTPMWGVGGWSCSNELPAKNIGQKFKEKSSCTSTTEDARNFHFSRILAANVGARSLIEH